MRYIIGLLIGIGLIVLLFVLIFRGGSSPAPSTIKPLVSYANTTTTVRYTDDYPIDSDQNHRVVETTVGRDQTTLNVEQGYQGTVIRSQSYANNPTSYANFLSGLQVSGYNKGDTSPALRNDLGQCPLGHRYIFEILNGNNIVQRFWSTSCGNIGSFKGDTATVQELFQRQVPDYNTLTSGLSNIFNTGI